MDTPTPHPRAVTGRQIGTAICNTLGLTPEEVVDLTINIPIDDVVTIDVTTIADRGRIEGFARYLTRYNLVPTEATDE